MGCNNPKNHPIDIFHPQFNLTFDGLFKKGFYVIPDSDPILAKQIGDTLFYYIFDQSMTTGKSKPLYMYCKFPIKSINSDSIEFFLIGRGCFKICECRNDDSVEFFYVRHQFKRFIFQVSIDKKNYTLLINYSYPQID